MCKQREIAIDESWSVLSTSLHFFTHETLRKMTK